MAETTPARSEISKPVSETLPNSSTGAARAASRKRQSLPVSILTGVAITGAAIAGAVGGEAKPANAASPTATATPNRVMTGTARNYTIATALAGKNEQLDKKHQKEQQEKDELEASRKVVATAQAKLDARLTPSQTPTATPTTTETATAIPEPPPNEEATGTAVAEATASENAYNARVAEANRIIAQVLKPTEVPKPTDVPVGGPAGNQPPAGDKPPPGGGGDVDGGGIWGAVGRIAPLGALVVVLSAALGVLIKKARGGGGRPPRVVRRS